MLESERLLLRQYTWEDLPVLHALLSNPVTMQFWPAPFTLEQSRQWIQRSLEQYPTGFGRFALIHKHTNALIGDAGLLLLEVDGRKENDLGYIIDCEYWKGGYGTEAAGAVMQYGLDRLRLKRICASMPVDHVGSRKVAERLGMKLEKQFLNKRNRDIPTCLYAKET
ncbi:GNAT family N-acetyltransferase [Paenibacillus sp. GD4]|jgi:[ribosomal protein S5]-alanine N-acetyltransferase|uniref:GNAT family N-acetyltransferase n=1 Tax=Paenibacillus sp. GD4 TaxID=3068890 RepID=UPI002796C345|nr:GNAT family N-acetyltransferase [Paenibacillus sp. GD4]MDQ1914674.1 GNAT family N-acetyltransferase [Paenibacillus sp. GD4]